MVCGWELSAWVSLLCPSVGGERCWCKWAETGGRLPLRCQETGSTLESDRPQPFYVPSISIFKVRSVKFHRYFSSVNKVPYLL